MSESDAYSINVDDLAADVIPVVKEGYLKKKKTKGVRFGRTIWNSRYFQVNNVERALIYSKTEDSPPLKKIPFTLIVSCKADNSEKKKVNKRRFRLITKSDIDDEYEENQYRKYFFEAESPSEAEDWIKCLHELSIEYLEKKRRREKIIMKARMSTIPYNPDSGRKLISPNIYKSDEIGKDKVMKRTASAVAVESEFDDDFERPSASKCPCCVVQ